MDFINFEVSPGPVVEQTTFFIQPNLSFTLCLISFILFRIFSARRNAPFFSGFVRFSNPMNTTRVE